MRSKGAEMAVGRRAPTLLDGRVYAGLPTLVIVGEPTLLPYGLAPR
jgi:hypothetical protein